MAGRVFHTLDGENRLVRLSIGEHGKISLSSQLPAIPSLSSLVAVGRGAKDKLREVRMKAQGRAQRRWRAAVTGDPDKRIRDHMREVPQVSRSRAS